MFYIQEGKVRLSVLSKQGKEATIALLGPGDFLGEGCIASDQPIRLATATAITECSVLKIEKNRMLRTLHEEHGFSDMFVAYVVERHNRTQADLVDQLFNSSEKRLARALLLLSRLGKEAKSETVVPQSESGNSGGNGWYHSLTCEFLHEQIQKAWFHRLQRRVGSEQFASQRCPARVTQSSLGYPQHRSLAEGVQF